MPSHSTKRLREILEEAKFKIPESEFCGIGVVLYLDYINLPVLPLCSRQFPKNNYGLMEQLAQASLLSNPCHDGFHLISSDFLLTHTNQYFAPPLPLNAASYIKGKNNVGARYMTALFGSLISSVRCTGIASEEDGIIIFEDGVEVG